MSDTRFPCGAGSTGNGCGKEGPKETVCIETNRILDSCRDRDCYENTVVFLTDCGQEIIEHTTQVRVKDCCIAWTYIGIDPVQFNRGFYAITIRFYIKLTFEGCINGRAQEFDGIAVIEKKVVLYGGESNVSIFRSSADLNSFCSEPEPCYKERTVPTAVVEAVDPIVLGVRVLEPACHEPIVCCCSCCDVPEPIVAVLSAPLCKHELDCDHKPAHRQLVVSLGIFSLVRVVRPAQYLIHASEFIIPDKECFAGHENDPCAIFRNMAFPVAEFAPPSLPTMPPDKSNRCC